MVPVVDLLTALIVDHDELLIVRCGDLLRAHGMKVRMAGGIVALARILVEDEIDVVIAGMEVPDLPAAEILRVVRAHDEELPVIFVSTWPDFDAGPARDGLRATITSAAVGYR